MTKNFNEISGWIVERISEHAEIDPSEVALDTDIVNFRLDSLLLVSITSELEEWLGMELNPSLFWEMGTIAATTNWILENQEV
ncbi:acyl carrier protein [Dyadobacter pollutisoli]|jgi:acyl carrier protein|uniref:Acyl carrier protein n=1 Tax=Dyadobacter pollutisoli TaxID=2910158 RepID=A0A9E8N860_9BACT|nr:acyl carrier protein [Dyadobacter pollutisoli]WAC10558.1 acyl carrier protein [Dyadobacter pollutisoli]